MMKTGFVSMDFLLFVLFIFGFITSCASENVKKSIDDQRDDTGESNYESKDESLDIAVETEPNNITCSRRQNSQMHEIRTATYKQFPFVVACMSQQNKYLCSGSVISNGLILTTAACTEQPLSHVLMNTTTDKMDETTVSLHVMKTERFPTYTAGEGLKNVGIVYIEKHNSSIASKIKLSNYTNPRLVADIQAIGFGLNADVGQVKELQYVGLEVRYAGEVADNLRGYFDCVETKVTTCFKDTGGPVVFDNEVMGIVTRGQSECTKEMSATFAINKRMIDFLPSYVFKAWLDEKIKKNEDQEPIVLATYPLKPEVSRTGPVHKVGSKTSGSGVIALPSILSTGFMCLLTLY